MLIRRRWALAAASILLIVVLVIVYRNTLARAGVAALGGLITGTSISLGDMVLAKDHATFRDVSVSRAGLPLLRVARVDVAYDLRALLPGGAPRYGLRAVTLLRPTLSLYRYADGSFNIGGGPSPVTPAAPAPQPAPGVPLVMDARVVAGTVVLHDPQRLYPDARELEVTRIDAKAAVDTAARSHYRVTTPGSSRTVRPSRSALPVRSIPSRSSRCNAYGRRRWPLHGIVNYLINARAAHLDAGFVRDADVAFYNGPHFTARARVVGARFRLVGFAKPLRDANGLVTARDGMAVTRDLSASVAGVPVRIAGGMYDFANPQLRLVADVRGPFGRLRKAFAFSARQPIEGDANIRALVEGPVSEPADSRSRRRPALALRCIPDRSDARDGSVL